ncbi:hypothetical protein C8A03DRAFT_33018 [Achaetomium macrosporum]|uniref:Uncharacterized protein n=1 Tax=Achaetomium macrosporum TaxID=79813 RepID=A0AAN7CBE2_9PEZI|nr:hypothetical protein C8A03DRAFT_33018 [Achaetomium macrosporum]
MASLAESYSGSPKALFFRGSRPPSPSTLRKLGVETLNLEAVNEKLKERTQSPESGVRTLFDELVEVGGVPLREYRFDDAERELDYEHGFYLREERFLHIQLMLWRRYAKRRMMDGLPDMRDLDEADRVAAFVT